MKTLFTQSRRSLTEKHTSSADLWASSGLIHPLNPSQIGNISASIVTRERAGKRERFMDRVSGKTLREKVRKRFDTESCKYFLIQPGRKGLCFFFFSRSGLPPAPAPQIYHKSLSLHSSKAERFLMECCHLSPQPRPFKQITHCLRGKEWGKERTGLL